MSKHPLQLNDTYPTDLDLVVADVLKELELASNKFGPFKSPHEGHSIMREEFDEFWDEIKRNNLASARAECVQVAAMAIRFLLDIE